MKVDVLTLFPEMFDGVFGASILGKAQTKGLVSLGVQPTSVIMRQISTIRSMMLLMVGVEAWC